MDAFWLAVSTDLETLLGLMREYYAADKLPFDEATARRALVGLLSNPDAGLAWLIEVDGVVVGYAVVCFGYSLEFGGRDAFIDELYLREAQRGQGIGRRMIAHIQTACRNNGVQALHLEVENDNERARAFYERLGFTEHRSRRLTARLNRS